MASEKHEKSKLANQTQHIPKDAQVICSILKEFRICDYEPRHLRSRAIHCCFSSREAIVLRFSKEMSVFSGF
jgi:hypothetical protein